MGRGCRLGSIKLASREARRAGVVFPRGVAAAALYNNQIKARRIHPPRIPGVTTMNRAEQARWLLSRRAFLGRSGAGLGALALASLLDPEQLFGADATKGPGRWPGAVKTLHHPA